MARKRFQKGSLIDEGDRWVVRYREDAIVGGAVTRVNKRQILGSKKEIPTKKLAQRRLDETLRAINHEDYRPVSAVTFKTFADRWVAQILIHQKPASQVGQRSLLNAHLLPAFGALYMKDISLELVQVFVNQSPLVASSIKHVVGLMMRMWDVAIGWGYANHNPFPRGVTGKTLLRLPKKVKKEVYKFSLEEAMAIIDKAPELKWKLLFWTLAEGGMRPGEIAGMRKTDLDGRWITLSQSVYRQRVQTQKTDSSNRRFRISQSLADELRAYMATTEDVTNPVGVGLVWTTAGGYPLDMGCVIKEVLNPILAELGIKAKLEALGLECGLYPFRHMNITEMRRRGVPLKTIQQRVGHAVGSNVTDEHYVHADDGDELEAADYLGALLSPKRDGEAVQ